MLSNQRASGDRYTKLVLTTIALLLGVLALRPLASPPPVQAHSEIPMLYIEPGIIDIKNPEGGLIGQGKFVIDLKTGDAWGFL